jgi:hypothetical protein
MPALTLKDIIGNLCDDFIVIPEHSEINGSRILGLMRSPKNPIEIVQVVINPTESGLKVEDVLQTPDPLPLTTVSFIEKFGRTDLSKWICIKIPETNLKDIKELIRLKIVKAKHLKLIETLDKQAEAISQRDVSIYQTLLNKLEITTGQIKDIQPLVSSADRCYQSFRDSKYTVYFRYMDGERRRRDIVLEFGCYRTGGFINDHDSVRISFTRSGDDNYTILSNHIDLLSGSDSEMTPYFIGVITALLNDQVFNSVTHKPLLLRIEDLKKRLLTSKTE